MCRRANSTAVRRPLLFISTPIIRIQYSLWTQDGIEYTRIRIQFQSKLGDNFVGTTGGDGLLVPERDVISETRTTTSHHSQELGKKAKPHTIGNTPKVNVRKHRTIRTAFTAQHSQRNVPITPPPTTNTREGAAMFCLLLVLFVVRCFKRFYGMMNNQPNSTTK